MFTDFVGALLAQGVVEVPVIPISGEPAFDHFFSIVFWFAGFAIGIALVVNIVNRS